MECNIIMNICKPNTLQNPVHVQYIIVLLICVLMHTDDSRAGQNEQQNEHTQGLFVSMDTTVAAQDYSHH